MSKIETDEGKLLDFDHITFWVANAKMTYSYFITRFGFTPLGYRAATDSNPIQAYAVKLNKITIIFESPTTADGEISKDLASHGDFVKDVAFAVDDLDELVQRAKRGGALIVKNVTEDIGEDGVIRYAVLKTYGDNTHTLIDRQKYNGVFLPGFSQEGDDPLNELLPDTKLTFIDHVEANMVDGTLQDTIAWYENNLNMHRFWCVDYTHELTPYSCINSDSVINQNETVLLSFNEAAKGLRPTSKATEFVKALGTSGVEHIALYTDDIISTIRNLKARGAEILSWPPTYYELIKEKLKNSTLNVSESVELLKEHDVLIDFDERGYMLQAFTKHVQARPTLFLEIIQRRNHKGFGAMNYKWVFEAIERMESTDSKTNEKN
ncbi:4-hydroxyphenylpyruvate dioxygenase-like [Battus philenor]|uniref:4-hydroxyphenylpyruvate dioxygenase-like n=1 Tax=Battus philenor TaxID=42288 RepID=UPI0035D0AAC4